MTIASQTSRISYVGDGVTTAFPVPFYFQANADLVVSVQDLAGNVTTKLLGTDYILTGATVSSGGTCTFTIAPTTGFIIAIYRVPQITQTTSYNNNDPFPAKSHELALDKLTTIDQYLKSQIDRAILVASTDTPPMTTLPPASVRALKAFTFDALGNPSVSTPITGTAVSSAMIPVVSASTLAIARALLGIPDAIATRTALKAIDTTITTAAYLTEAGREGEFVFRAGNYAARVTADTQEGVYIKANAISTSVGAWVRINDGRLVSSWFGTVGDNVTDDSTASAACVAMAVSVGGIAYFPPGMYKTTTAIPVTGHVRIVGAGYQSSPISYGFGATVANFDTRSTGIKATVFVCSATNSAFSVATTDSISIEDIQITYPAGGNAGVAGLLLNTAAGSNGANFLSTVRNVLINNAAIGAQVNDWLDFVFDSVKFVTCGIGAVCKNTTSINFTGITTAGTTSDSTFINCTFFNTQGNNCIQLLTGGGYRIVNNKFNSTSAANASCACVLVSPQDIGVAFSMEPLLFVGNSFEGSPIGILGQPASTSLGQGSQWVITGNQFFVSKYGIQTIAGTAVPTWISELVISGSVFNVGTGFAGAFCCNIDGVTYANISGNSFAGNTSGNASVFRGASSNNFKITGNHYQGFMPSPGNVAVAVPASTVQATNNTGYVVSVNVQGGTVTGVTVQPYQGSGIGVAVATNTSTVLNPGDKISVTYSAAPVWTWMVDNP